VRSLLLVVVWLAGCTPTPAPQSVGCGKDVDCKGDRICVQHACVAPRVASVPDPASTSSADAPVTGTSRPTASATTPPPAPQPSASSPDPEPRGTVSSGSRTGPPRRCDCRRDDLMCAMKCAQRDNPVAPPTFPNEPAPQDDAFGLPPPH
jgi:hypothetical protein